MNYFSCQAVAEAPNAIQAIGQDEMPHLTRAARELAALRKLQDAINEGIEAGILSDPDITLTASRHCGLDSEPSACKINISAWLKLS
jgi:hypothetical protein